MRWLQFLALALSISLFSCATKETSIFVTTYHLKDIEEVDKNNKMMRAEQQRRLKGAVEESDQLDRVGLYYTADWQLEDGLQTSPEKVVFRYKQAATGSKEKRLETSIDSSKRKGSCEFNFIGDVYRANGRILAWRAELYAEGKIVAYEQSYLWE